MALACSNGSLDYTSVQSVSYISMVFLFVQEVLPIYFYNTEPFHKSYFVGLTTFAICKKSWTMSRLE